MSLAERLLVSIGMSHLDNAIFFSWGNKLQLKALNISKDYYKMTHFSQLFFSTTANGDTLYVDRHYYYHNYSQHVLSFFSRDCSQTF